MTEYHPIITQTAIIIDLHKPIYGSFFGIWKKWLDIAKAHDLNIIVNTPFGKSTFTYSSYMKGAKKMKRFYKNPNEPMIFMGREFSADIIARDERKAKESKEKKIETNFFDMFSKMPDDKRAELRAKLGLR